MFFTKLVTHHDLVHNEIKAIVRHQKRSLDVVHNKFKEKGLTPQLQHIRLLQQAQIDIDTHPSKTQNPQS